MKRHTKESLSLEKLDELISRCKNSAEIPLTISSGGPEEANVICYILNHKDEFASRLREAEEVIRFYANDNDNLSGL